LAELVSKDLVGSYVVKPVSSWRAELGEGPRWDRFRQRLLTVDITGGILRSSSYDGEMLHDQTELRCEGFIAVAESISYDTYLVAQQSIVEWREWGGGLLDKVILPLDPGERMNDGTMFPDGSFVVGTMSVEGKAGFGKLWRIVRGQEPQLVRDGLGIPNGIVWDDVRGVVYWVDSLAGELSTFSLASDGVDWNNPRSTWDLSADGGAPDGIALDAEGNIWVAKWGASRIQILSPAGDSLAQLPLPVSQPTSCVFAGDGKTLFITSATYGLDATQLEAEPHSGRLFVAKPC
jgi:sugar lactone lactonase YvrE